MSRHLRTPEPYEGLASPEWARSATLYQLNTRQFTTEGTLRAAAAHLPRLQALGADIIWLMPIHPIGERRRKGTLGSPYAVRDYFSVNPELGTLDDLRAFVQGAHARGMRVILDWVANHTAWDNGLVSEHPDWYARDDHGDLRPTPWWDWTDIIELDFAKPGLRDYMTQAMAYWVREADVDGFRCDVAGFVPVDFWEDTRRALDGIKPVFMLAEWESRDLHARAFDASYAWSWHDALQRIAAGAADVSVLDAYYAANERAYPPGSMRMTFVSNHDMNAWKGTQFEQFGDALEAAIVLSVVSEGIPLLYCGQEAGVDRRLAFFERDPIEWREHWVGDLYRRLFRLKHDNRALWNGRWGARMAKVPNSADSAVLSFVRRHARDAVFAVFNLSAQTRQVTFANDRHFGAYMDVFRETPVEFSGRSTMTLNPWAYRVFTQGMQE